MNIGKNITAFRKDAGMTQEELAGQIGVSAQAVSKWETGVSMPDILLLPVIADVFGITVDEIYTGKRKTKEEVPQHYSFDDLAGVLYENILKGSTCAWKSLNTEEQTKWLAELKSNLNENSRCANFEIGDHGGAVLILRDMALVAPGFGTKESLDILNSDAAIPILELLIDRKVRYLFRYLIDMGEKMFTAAGLSKKTGMSVEECRAILHRMSEANLLWLQNVDADDDEEITIYSVFQNNTKPLYACMILRLAERLGTNGEYFYGYRGCGLPVDKD